MISPKPIRRPGLAENQGSGHPSHPVSSGERQYLRELAGRVAEAAQRPEMAAIKQRWRDVNSLRRPDRAPVWCKPVGAWSEILTEESFRCTDPWLRGICRICDRCPRTPFAMDTRPRTFCTRCLRYPRVLERWNNTGLRQHARPQKGNWSPSNAGCSRETPNTSSHDRWHRYSYRSLHRRAYSRWDFSPPCGYSNWGSATSRPISVSRRWRQESSSRSAPGIQLYPG